MAEKKDYEIIARVDFGGHRNEFGDLLPAEEQPGELWGVYEPDPEGEDNPVVSLPEGQAKQLLEAGAIKPAGEDLPRGLHHDNPEEFGYEGQAARDKALKDSEGKKGSAKSKAHNKE